MDFTTSFGYSAGVTINSIGAGLLLGLLNWTFWRFATRWLVSKQGAKGAIVGFLSLFKLGLLAATIWFLLTRLHVDPIGFLIGFGAVTTLTLAKGLK